MGSFVFKYNGRGVWKQTWQNKGRLMFLFVIPVERGGHKQVCGGYGGQGICFFKRGRGECLQEPFKRLHWLCWEGGSCRTAVGLRFASSEPGGQEWSCSHLYSSPGDWAWQGEGAVLECLGQQRRMEQVLNHGDDLLVLRGVTLVSGPGMSALYLHYHSTGAHTTPAGGPYLLYSIYRQRNRATEN